MCTKVKYIGSYQLRAPFSSHHSIIYISTLLVLIKFEIPKRQSQIDICSAEFTVQGLIRYTETTQNCQDWHIAHLRHELKYHYTCHCKCTHTQGGNAWVCVCLCDKAAHLLMTWSLFLAFLSLIQNVLLPLWSKLLLLSHIHMHPNDKPSKPLAACASHPLLLLLNVTTVHQMVQFLQYVWWHLVSHTSFSLSHSICLSACHSSVALLSIKPVS